MTLFEYLKEIKQSANDRLKSPVAGSFTMFFVIWNWRPILLLFFSSMTIEDKIKEINDNYCSVWNFFWTLLLTVIYLPAAPYLLDLLEKATSKATISRKKSLSDIRLTELLNQGGILKQEKINNDIRSGNLEKQQLITENETLTKRIDELNKREVENLNIANATIEKLNETIYNQIATISDQESEYYLMKKQLFKLLMTKGINEITENWSDLKKSYYVDFYNNYKAPELGNPKFKINVIYIEDYDGDALVFEKGLKEVDTYGYVFTPLGHEVYKNLIKEK